MKDEKVQTVEKIDRQDIALSYSTKPKKYTVSHHKKEKIIEQATLKGDHILLTDRGTEYCGKIEEHAYQLFLSVMSGAVVGSPMRRNANNTVFSLIGRVWVNSLGKT